MAPIDRAKAQFLFAEQFQAQVIEHAVSASTALATLPTVPMSTKVARQPVLTALPEAKFITEGSVKPATTLGWDGVVLTAEELAATVVIHDAVLEDTQINLTETLRTRLGEAFARAIDAAVFFGTGAPATWPTGGILAACFDTIPYTDVDTWRSALSGLWNQGLNPTNVWAGNGVKGHLLHPVAGGQMIAGLNTESVYGTPVATVANWDADTALAIVGDRAGAIIGVRQDVRFDFSKEATVDGINLFEQDATAIRAYARFAFAIAKPVTPSGETGKAPFVAVGKPDNGGEGEGNGGTKTTTTK